MVYKLIKKLALIISIFFSGIISAKATSLNLENVSELPVFSLERDDARGNLIGFAGGKGLTSSEGRPRKFLGAQKDKFYKGKYNYYLYPNPNSREKANYPYRRLK